MGARRLIPAAATLATVAMAGGGCGSSHATTAQNIPPGPGLPPGLVRESRPIGQGARFHPPASGPILGPCRRDLGPRQGVHVEVFADDKVVLLATGIGVKPPLRFNEGRIAQARCYGDLVTLEPTGVLLLRPGTELRLAEVFKSWGQLLSGRKLVSFTAARGTRVSVFVNGLRWTGSPGNVPLTRHDEIVLEVGPHVPPHSTYTFPPGA